MSRARLVGTTLLAMLGLLHAPTVHPADADVEVVFEWNQLLQATLPADAGLRGARFFALMHIAMFDAVNALEPRFEPYRVRNVPKADGTADAAAAQAAHDVLTALIGRTKAYDDALAKRLGSSHATRGAAVGAFVAKDVLSWRSTDGWADPSPPLAPYVNPQVAGRWQPSPPNNAAAAFTHLRDAAPLAILTSTQFLPAPPPTLTSARYATDFNEVKSVGKADSTTRTPEQTQTSLMWAGVGTTTSIFAIWNNIARDVAVSRRLPLVETARLFALLNVSIHDSVMTTQVSKFAYGLWRPVTAIRRADEDLNPDTVPDAGWLPLLTTPPYPAYGGNMAAVGAGAATALALATGSNAFEAVARWQRAGEAPVVHTFGGFWEAAQEQGMSRIWGGIHFRSDQEAGQEVGKRVAAFVAANCMQPRRATR